MTEIDQNIPKINSTDSSFKNDEISNFIFSYQIKYHGTIEIVSPTNSGKIFSDFIAKSILTDHLNSAPIFEYSSAFIFRSDPSKNTFNIEKFHSINSESETTFLYPFNDLVAACSLELTGEKIGQYTCFILKTPHSSYFYAVIISFNDDETRNRLIRTLKFCQDVIQQNNVNDCVRMVVDPETYTYSAIHLQTTIEIYETEFNNGYSAVPHEKDAFKVRENIEKSIEISIKPTAKHDFLVDRCFGVLYSTIIDDQIAMILFDKFDYTKINEPDSIDSWTHIVRVNVSPKMDSFVIFSTNNTGYGHFTIAVDFVLKNVVSPIRIEIPFKIKLHPVDETFFIINRNPITSNTLILLKRVSDSLSTDLTVVDVSEFNISKSYFRSSFDSIFASKSKTSDENKRNFDNDKNNSTEANENEMVLSGTFSFTPEISNEAMTEWCKALEIWKEKCQPPPNLQKLLKMGIPSSYRKNVWLFLLGIYDTTHKSYSLYQELSQQTSEYEKVIIRDVNRTFPAHDYFKEFNGKGQQELFRVCKAYSIFDPEVGYCQGLSFIVADFLLHVDEVNAFVLLVELMKTKNHRELFIQAFEQLNANLYVLKRLTIDFIPELGKHLSNLGVEPHMYAPQWLLTIFTAKFPLGLVDQALDMVFSMGKRSILQISLAILTLCQKDILPLNFEETLKYFRLNMPKKFTNPYTVKKLFTYAYNLSLSPSLIEEMLLDFQRYKKDMIMTQDPLLLAKSENKMLFERQLRLEQENDLLAQELITNQVNTKKINEELKEKNAELMKKMDLLTSEITTVKEFNSHLINLEIELKEESNKNRLKTDEIINRKENLINHYKNLTHNLEEKEQEIKISVSKLREKFLNIVQNCESCLPQYNALIYEPVSSDGSVNILLNHEEQNDKKRIETLEMDLAKTKMRVAEAEGKYEELIYQNIQRDKKSSKSIPKWIKKFN